MRNRLVYPVFLLLGAIVFAQGPKEDENTAVDQLSESTNITYEANESLVQNDFLNAEADYRRAISKSDKNSVAPYNLGRAYYNREKLVEAFGRFKQAGAVAEAKPDKHKAFHNMGNVFMKGEEYEKAVEAYKEALRNNPNDEETRYNLALAKEMLKKQQDQNQNDDQGGDNQDQNKDQDSENQNQDNQGENEEKENQGEDKDQENEGEGEEGNDGEGEPEENEKGDGEEKEEQKKQPNQGEEQERKEQPRPNQLSKQQIQNLLEAMQNEEKKVQEKIDAKKVKGAKIRNEKDW